MAFEKRYLDETPSADVRVIIPTEDKTGEEILEEWKSGAATEDSFAELCKKYTQDTSAVENGGLFEQVTKTGMTEEQLDLRQQPSGRRYRSHHCQ